MAPASTYLVHPSDYRIKGGDHDETSNWLQLAKELPQGGGVVFPPGLLSVITAPLPLNGKQEIFITCERRSLYPDAMTGFDYRGPEGTVAIQGYSTDGLVLKGIKVFINQDGKRAQGGIDIDQLPSINGVTGDVHIEGVSVVSDGSSATAFGIAIARTSPINGECVHLEQVQATFRDRWQQTADLDRGVAILVGGLNGAGANAKTITIERCRGVGGRSMVKAFGGASLAIRDGYSQYCAIDHELFGNVATIDGSRSENSRQFLVGSGTLTARRVEPEPGAWDPQYPVFYVRGCARLALDTIDFADRPNVVAVDADPQGECSVEHRNVHFPNGKLPSFANFSNPVSGPDPDRGIALRLAGGHGGHPVGVQGVSMHMGSGTQRAYVKFRLAGPGTMLYVNDAKPGLSVADADALNAPECAGAGAILLQDTTGALRTI